MPEKKILVVEDDLISLEYVKQCLSKDGYDVTGASSGLEALRIVQNMRFDLIILDLVLPDVNGIVICRNLKQNFETKDIPVIMLTLKSGESDIINGFEEGADDYILKPFNPKVFIARINALLRRNKNKMLEAVPVHILGLKINTVKREILAGKIKNKLTTMEYVILMTLANNPGRIFSREDLINNVLDKKEKVTNRSVDVQIVGLRKKLGNYAHYIETVRGAGYRFKSQN